MSREHAHAYEAGYRDGSINYELEHCPACKNVADLQEVLEENAKLREQMERLRTQLADVTESVGRVEERCAKTFEVGKRWMAKAARFEAENAKLRELCADMWHVMWACAEQRCKHRENECYVVNGNNGALPSHDECWYKQRMRELGVEVDE